MTRVVVIGAGVGGLTTAGTLARSGADVTVLEAHIYPGGCAGTFFHQGYRFDAGATLAGGFYPGGPMDLVARAVGIDTWPGQAANPALVVHLPGGRSVTRWSDARRWPERREGFGAQAESFWRWQEAAADALWDLALRTPPWPPQSLMEGAHLLRKGLEWLAADAPRRINPQLAADALRPVGVHLRKASKQLRLFVDAQLLISAQTTSRYANALYGAAALDLPRRGVVHLAGGMGAIGQALAKAVEQNGGEVHYRQEVRRIIRENGRPVAVKTKRGEAFSADLVIANLPPWNVAALLDGDVPRRLRQLPPRPKIGWGAFMVYVGLDSSVVPDDYPLHHQVVLREPLGEGNTVFLSLSPAWDESRAPKNKRALTISTHTNLDAWWELFERDRNAYDAQNRSYTERVLCAAETALPGLTDAANLVLSGTPVTFQRFTRRSQGWVGGFPQTHLLQGWGPRLASGVWMVGDSIFPGQSTTAVGLGGLRVGYGVLREIERNRKTVVFPPSVRRLRIGLKT